MKTTYNDKLQQRACDLGLVGLIAHWSEFQNQLPIIRTIIEHEENTRHEHLVANRFKLAQLNTYRPMADFDWKWPKKIDRPLIEELFTLSFIKEKTNIVLVGPNGVGKTMIAKNLAHDAILAGYKVLFVNAGRALNKLSGSMDGATLERKLSYFAMPDVLILDEVGYLSYANRHADILFQLIERRYEKKTTIITTNKPFAEWNEVFPNAACAVTLVDRITHNADVVCIEANASRRLLETEERNKKKKAQRAKTKQEVAF